MAGQFWCTLSKWVVRRCQNIFENSETAIEMVSRGNYDIFYKSKYQNEKQISGNIFFIG